MVILGLGSNVGDRLANLRRALEFIKQIPSVSVTRVSSTYLSSALLPANAPDEWNKSYLNVAIRCETTLTPDNLLAKLQAIEIAIGRTPAADWAPRVIDIDILAWDDRILSDPQLHLPHHHLHERLFALLPLTEIAPFWIYPQQGPFKGQTAMEILRAAQTEGKEKKTTCERISPRIDAPALVGILNITPDSFSDGGYFTDLNPAIAHAHQLVKEGAEILDLGAEASGPHAKPITPAEEWQRLEPLLQHIMQERSKMIIPPKISIDTRHPDVAKKALAYKVDWINDVSGLENPLMQDILVHQPQEIVVMHNLGIPTDVHKTLSLHSNPIDVIYQWAEEKLTALTQAGISQERIIFDVGIGFGKTAEQSLELIKQIAIFHQLKTRLLVGHSRKSFLRLFTDKPAPQRDFETVLLSLQLAKQGIHFLRVHNIALHAQAFRV